MRPESGAREVVTKFGTVDSKRRPNLGCHFQGTSPYASNPGLKPWAILSDHFMVKN
jgi:hypothetical protein